MIYFYIRVPVFFTVFDINPLLPEAFFPSNIEIQPKMDSYRLPTPRRGTSRKFFLWSLLFLNKQNLGKKVLFFKLQTLMS